MVSKVKAGTEAEKDVGYWVCYIYLHLVVYLATEILLNFAVLREVLVRYI